jgi:hypothetical protein
MPTDTYLIAAVTHLRTHGPVTTHTGRPCSYDVREYLRCDELTYDALHALAEAGRLVEHPSPQGHLYPNEFDLP